MALERRPGRPPVMADVARAAGVSQKTVSRVVNGAPNVRETVRSRVLEAIDDLGFRPNAAARALVTHRTATIGIVTAAIPLYGPSAQLFGLERAAREAGYAVVIVSTADGGRVELEAAVDRLLALQADGLATGAPVRGAGSRPPGRGRWPADVGVPRRSRGRRRRSGPGHRRLRLGRLR